MLDDRDVQTFYSLRNLQRQVSDGSQPLLIWIGAGVSRWRGLPAWEELATQLHTSFSKFESHYDRRNAGRYLSERDFPAVFQQCRNVNQGRYYRVLASALQPNKKKSVYLRFVNSLRAIQPVHILTTNVDELLENSLEDTPTVQRSNLGRCLELLRKREGFVGKIHGSLSQVESMVFTTADYDMLLRDENYLELIRHIFVETTVLFLGYGLRDQYVLDLLARSDQLQGLFADRTHYAVISDSDRELPSFISPIRYVPSPHKDHRSSIQVIEELSTEMKLSPELRDFSIEASVRSIKSAHLISDIFPPGRRASAGYEYKISDGARVLHGVGLTAEELLNNKNTSTHDLIIGLICFETVYVHLTSIGNLMRVVGQYAFERMLREDSLRFIEWPIQTVIRFPPEDLAGGGELHTVALHDETPSETLRKSIRRSLDPIIGKKDEAEEIYELIERKSESIPTELEFSTPKFTQGLLMRPSIRNLLGMSGGTSVSRIPEWIAFPILRLAYVVKLGATCQSLGIASTKLDQGFAELAAPAFSAAIGAEWADGMASYVLARKFNTDLTGYTLRDQRVVDSILKFRASNEGVKLRHEILDQLAIQQSADFVASINAGLRAVVPTTVLQAAQDKMAGLLFAKGVIENLTPTVWNNTLSMRALTLWKARSRLALKQYTERHRIDIYDPCPCRSGEQLRFCCNESLEMR